MVSTRVDRGRLRSVGKEVRDEPPAQQIKRALAGVRVSADDPQILARRAIVARRNISEAVVAPGLKSFDNPEAQTVRAALLDDAPAHPGKVRYLGRPTALFLMRFIV
jgi:hypothetical protein